MLFIEFFKGAVRLQFTTTTGKSLLCDSVSTYVRSSNNLLVVVRGWDLAISNIILNACHREAEIVNMVAGRLGFFVVYVQV